MRSALLADPEVASYLREREWSSLRPVPLDAKHWRVTVLDGEQAILDATVGPHGEVSGIAEHPANRVPIGSQLFWSPAVLTMLALVFCAALAVVPLCSLRNLDASVLGGGFLLELLLYKYRFVAPHIAVATAVLAYLGARVAWTALHPAAPARPARSLLGYLAQRADPASRRRLSAVSMGALVLLGAMLIITSTGISDIALVNLAGATVIKSGELPYGNFPPALGHGDTYPLFSYLLFLPGALLSPVSDYFDDLQSALNINVVAYLAAAFFVYGAVFKTGRDRGAAALATAAWLAFPPVVFAASSGTNDVPTAAFVALALFAWQRPAIAAAALALAGWAKVVPALALATQFAPLRGRRLIAAATGVAAVCGAGVAVLYALGGGVGAMLDAMRFQTERGSLHSVWWQLDALGAQRAFQAATLGVLAAMTCAIALRPELRNLRSTAAASALVLILVQLAGNYWNATYLPWVMPLVLVGLFAGHRSST